MDSMLTRLISSGVRELRHADDQIGFLEERLFNSYEPSQPPKPNFGLRLKAWIENFEYSETDASVMFQSILNLFYIGPEEFMELYKFAYNGVIARWLIEKYDIQLDDPNAHTTLKQAEAKTWFCPITDSMRISSFYHVNSVSSHASYRPEWRSLARFNYNSTGIDAIKEYCTTNGVDNLVLLEDFVGGGSQIGEIFSFMSEFENDLNILVAPLIICQNGVTNIQQDLRSSSIDFCPVLKLNHTAFISENPQTTDCELTNDIRDIVNNTYLVISDGILPSDDIPPYHPFGWNKIGGLVVMYSNTPDNTLPLYHHTSDSWNALFPRHSRE